MFVLVHQIVNARAVLLAIISSQALPHAYRLVLQDIQETQLLVNVFYVILLVPCVLGLPIPNALLVNPDITYNLLRQFVFQVAHRWGTFRIAVLTSVTVTYNVILVFCLSSLNF